MRGTAAVVIDTINTNRTHVLAAAVRTAGRSMSMMTNTLARYFAGRFVGAAVGVFMGVFVLVVLVDYIEMMRKTSGLRRPRLGRADFAVPRAAVAREADAVLRPGRRDVLLPRPVAAAGTRGGALCRRFGVAIPVAGARGRDRDRRAGDHRLQSDVGQSAGAVQAQETELFGDAPGG